MATQFISKETLAQYKPAVQMPAGLDIREHVREMGRDEKGGRIYEFIGTDTFGSEWNQRVRFEVDAGRDQEPILYTPFYSEIRDANLPKLVDIQKIGPGGVVFEEVFEGGEVKFASVSSSEESVAIRHFGVGLEYSKDLFIFNQLWNVSIVERQAGIAFNALLNHLHFNPILAYSYSGANQTAANTGGDSIAENYVLTLEDAITNAKADTSNPRRGPYALLVASANMFMWERALFRVPQVGFSKQSSALDVIRAVVAYDGWTGTRGAKTTTYSGVSANKAYLVDLANRDMDLVSYVKQDLEVTVGNPDVSRFIREQSVYDVYRGVYSNPLRCVEEVTLPTTA
jgi:hypothetical protein